MRTYVRSAPALEDAIAAHREGLESRAAGGAVRQARSGPDGRFTLEAVPPGRWLLIVRAGAMVAVDGKAAKRKDREQFRVSPRLTGYRAVDVWLNVPAVEAGGDVEVELNDRNVWMTAIEEERTPDVGR
jgi:hypothetical protein